MKVLGISLITNKCIVDVKETSEPNHAEVFSSYLLITYYLNILLTLPIFLSPSNQHTAKVPLVVLNVQIVYLESV